MKKYVILFVLALMITIGFFTASALSGVREVRTAPTGTGGPGALRFTSEKKPEPVIIAQGTLETVDFEATGDHLNEVYYWHITFTGGRNVVIERHDLDLILDIGTEYKVTVDPETRTRDIVLVEE